MTNQLNENAGRAYSTYNSVTQTLSISVDASDNLVLQNIANPSNPTQWIYQWYQKLNDDLDTALENNKNLKWNLTINAPKSTIILKSNSSLKESPKLGEGGEAKLNISAKEIRVGDGSQTYDNLFSFFEGSNAPSQLFVMNQNDKIQSDILVNKDGALIIGNNSGSLTSFTLEGNLKIEGGGLAVAAMGGGENPYFDVNGRVEINNATLQTFLNANGLMGDLRIVKANGGISLNGNNKMQIATSYFLQDFVDIDKTHIDYGSAQQTQTDLYVYTFNIDGNTLYATPQLSESAKKEGVVKLVRDATNKIAIRFYNYSKDSLDSMTQRLEECKNNPSWSGCSATDQEKMQKQLQDYQASLDGLSAYLQKQVDEGYIQAPSPYTLLSSTPISETPQPKTTPTSSTALSTTGFDNIDFKLSTIKEGVNNALAESIKNSSNNLLAVNFVNTLMQGYNNTPIELINEARGNAISLSQALSLFRNDLSTTLALSSRFANFSFAPKKTSNPQETNQLLNPQTLNSPNPLSLKDSQESVISIQDDSFNLALSNSLWANAFGGANLLGSSTGASYGFNLGYDRALDNTLLGAYLSYAYTTLSPLSTLSLNSHHLKLGVYSRIEKGGNEIDLELSSLLSIISQESITKALDSKSNADFLSSLSEFKATYGYAFLEGEFKFKPLVGLALSLSYTPSFKESGDIEKDFGSQTNFNANFQAGVELRKTFSNQGFLYTTLSIEQDLYNSQDSLVIDSQTISFTPTLKTYAKIVLGGEIVINKNWNIALSLGAKQSIIGSKDYENKAINETYINGSVGVGYRF